MGKSHGGRILKLPDVQSINFDFCMLGMATKDEKETQRQPGRGPE